MMRTECLVAPAGDCALSITVRFLHIVERKVRRIDGDDVRAFEDVAQCEPHAGNDRSRRAGEVSRRLRPEG